MTADTETIRIILREELDHTLAHYATKADQANLKADLHALETRLIKWIIGAVVVGSSLVGTIVSVVDRLAS
ncbi:MAG: hypothetical protein OXP73_09060 [Chloroflexota bacterium]|nr:hypothetical protein [Chloroflexota bacterium]